VDGAAPEGRVSPPALTPVAAKLFAVTVVYPLVQLVQVTAIVAWLAWPMLYAAVESHRAANNAIGFNGILFRRRFRFKGLKWFISPPRAELRFVFPSVARRGSAVNLNIDVAR
jgi:hypothetical protein